MQKVDYLCNKAPYQYQHEVILYFLELSGGGSEENLNNKQV